MSAYFMQDNGPGTVLTEDHRYAIEEAIRGIDFELTHSGPEHVAHLNRQRDNMVAELAAGKRLQENFDIDQ